MSPSRHPLLWILAAALAVRVVAALGVQAYLDGQGREFLIAGDAEGYRMLSARIAAGDEYSLYNPPRRVMRMPGFPLLLAGVRVLFGPSLLPARLVLAGVATAGVAAVYALGRTLDGEPTGLIAASLCAAWPVLAGFSVLILSETLFAVLLTVSLCGMARLVRGVDVCPVHATYWAGLTGVFIACASLVRPTWLPAAGLFPWGYWLAAGRTRGATVRAAVCALAAAATLAPWVARNAAITGRFIPTTLWVGPSLYDGLSPTATGESDMRFFDSENLLGRMSEYDMDRTYRRRAVAFAADHPGRAAALAVEKLRRYFQPWPSAEQFAGWPAAVLVAGYYLPVALLAGVGAWARRRDVWLLVLCAGPLFFFAAVHAVFVGSLRYRLPAEYPLCVLAAVGIRVLLRKGGPVAARGPHPVGP